MTASAWLGLVASAVYLGRLLPQPVKTLRTGRVEGVSALGALNVLVADLAWLFYGLSERMVPVWAVSIPSLAASAWTVRLLGRTLTGRDLQLAGAWAAVLVGAGTAGLLSAALAATVVVTCGPQLWAVYRGPDLQGVSSAAWLMAVADAGAWGAYGLVTGSAAVELYGIVLLLTSGAVLFRLGTTRPATARLSAGWDDPGP